MKVSVDRNKSGFWRQQQHQQQKVDIFMKCVVVVYGAALANIQIFFFAFNREPRGYKNSYIFHQRWKKKWCCWHPEGLLTCQYIFRSYPIRWFFLADAIPNSFIYMRIRRCCVLCVVFVIWHFALENSRRQRACAALPLSIHLNMWPCVLVCVCDDVIVVAYLYDWGTPNGFVC